MKYILIGAGWYGCHIATVLREHGKDVILVDKSNTIFSGSSIRNQNRLHLGFHYPRSPSTIEECKHGYTQFLNKYNSFASEIPKNIYYISTTNSLVDIHTYIETMNKAGVSYDPSSTNSTDTPLRMKGVEDICFNTKELYINHNIAQTYFREILDSHFIRDIPSEIFTSISSITNYLQAEDDDIILNCTYNQLNPISFHSYELFLSLIYKIDTIDLFAITLMDGPFFSIYPYDIEKNLYTVTSVEHGVVYSGKTVIPFMLDESILEEKKAKIENLLNQYIDNWTSFLKYDSYNLSWKTKPYTDTDDRSVRIERQGNTVNMYGGKITGIFNAEQYVLQHLLNLNND